MDPGLEAFQSGKIEEALEIFTAAIAEYSQSMGKSWTSRISMSSKRGVKTVITKTKLAALYTNQGLCRHNLGDVEGSLESFNTALSLVTSSKALFNRGIAHKDLGQLNEALKDFRKVQSLDSTLLSAVYGEAWVLTDQCKFAEAIKVVDRAEKMEKMKPSYDQLKEFRKRESLNSFKASSQSKGSKSMSGKSEIQKQGQAGSTDALSTGGHTAPLTHREISSQLGAVHFFPTLCDAHFIRSFSLLHMGKPEEALQECKRGMGIGDNRFHTLELCLCCLVKTSVSLQKRGIGEEAVSLMDEALKVAIMMEREIRGCETMKQSHNATVQYKRDVGISRCLLLAEQAREDQAIEALCKMLEDNRVDSDIHCALGNIYATKSNPDFEQAKIHLNKADKANQKPVMVPMADRLYQLGVVLLHSGSVGSRGDAVQAFLRAQHYSPHDTKISNALNTVDTGGRTKIDFFAQPWHTHMMSLMPKLALPQVYVLRHPH
jgi:tetratricopeptide (TPR) repeat protein